MAPPGRTRQLVAVGVGGAIGGTARYLLTEIFPEPPGAFPLTTLAINVTGAFLLPLAVTVIAAALAAPTLIRLLVTTGILSSFTTFSAVVYATDSLIRDGATAVAIWYPLLTVGLGLLAALVGWGLGHRIALKNSAHESHLMTVLLVAVAAAIGAQLRYGADLVLTRIRLRSEVRRRDGWLEFPWATLAVNVVGSALIGAIGALALSESAALAQHWATALTAGLAGALTTFSTVTFDALQLWLARRWRAAALSLLANFALGMGAAALAWQLTASAVN